jgi:hypothetical protein
MATSTSDISSVGRWNLPVLGAGAGVLVIAAALYLSGASRAVGVWMVPVGLAAVVMGGLGLSGRRVPRWCYLVLAVIVLVLAVLGLATWVYALMHPPMSV